MQETQETRVQSLGREDPLKQERGTCPSIFAWKIPWRGAWQATVHRVAKIQTGLSMHAHKLSSFYLGGCWDLFILWPSKPSLVCKFPWLLNLPPANQECSASLFDLSFPSLYRGQLQILPRLWIKSPRLQTINCLIICHSFGHMYLQPFFIKDNISQQRHYW